MQLSRKMFQWENMSFANTISAKLRLYSCNLFSEKRYKGASSMKLFQKDLVIASQYHNIYNELKSRIVKVFFKRELLALF